jgi:hypothetical protein
VLLSLNIALHLLRLSLNGTRHQRSMMPLMHDDATAILRSFTEEALAKSRKVPKDKRAKGGANGKSDDDTELDTGEDTRELGTPSSSSSATLLQQLSEDDLVRELARRRAGNIPGKQVDPIDPTGQECTLNGGEGSIPCRELME